VRASIVDDLALARRIRETGLRLAVGDGQHLVSCRMYRSAREVIDGFTKNLHAAVGGRATASAALALMLLALFTVPPLVAIFTREPSWIIATMLGIALRLRLSGRRDDSVASALAHPIAIALAVGVLLRSMMRPGIAWKGRTVG
ncbi:MAG: glycosyl transferase, partial [Thermoanaerobaculia bacterium]